MEIVPDSSRQPYDMYDVIREIVDDGDWFDLKPKFAKSVITCFARFGGQPVGDRRQPAQAAGRHPRQRLRRQGGPLHQPLRRLQHPARLPPGRPRLHGRLEGRARRDHPPRGEDALRGQPRHGAEGDRVVRKAYGAGYYVMCGKAYEPDLIVAWPGAEISVMGAEGAVEIIGRSAIEASEDPEATREAMLNAVRAADRPLHRRRQRGDRRHHRPARDPPDDRQSAADGAQQARREAEETTRRDAGLRADDAK